MEFVQEDKSTDEIDLRELVKDHLRYWPIYAATTFVCLLLAFAYLRYSDDMYQVTSTILIEDKDSGGISNELTAFQDISLIGGMNTNVLNEIGVLKSLSLMKKVVKDLNLNLTFHHKGRFVDVELYKEHVPFKVIFFEEDTVINNSSIVFEIEPVSSTKYLLENMRSGMVAEGVFGKNLKADFGEVNITPIDPNRIILNETTVVRLHPVEELALNLQGKIEVEEKELGSSLIEMTMTYNHRLKAIDILDNLVDQYNKEVVDNKRQLANNTNEFINDRLKKISSDLTRSDLNVEEYKTKNQLSNIGAQASIILESNSQIEERIIDLNSQVKLIDYVIDYINSNPDDLIPSNLGIRDQNASKSADAYNQLIMERNRIQESSSELNPTVINLNSQLRNMRESIDQSLRNTRASLTFALEEVRNQGYRLNSKISSAPKQEREIRDIERQQQITETLYLYLLQKREENAISLVGIAPNAKIVDRANGVDLPISPQPKIIYAISFILGIILPFVGISLFNFFDNKIHTIEDIERILPIPILGDIPNSSENLQLLDFSKEKSSVAEGFRILRTNLDFMFLSDQINGKTIFVTSTISGEGKTFISMNLAGSLSSNRSRVLLIGADLRLPTLTKYVDIDSSIGLTDFLVDREKEPDEVIYRTGSLNFDIIPSGAVPPNPADLLMNGRFEELIEFGRGHYDYIVVDTPPVNLVTDTLLIGKHSDLTIYVARANYIDKRMMMIPRRYFEKKQLPNMAILLNATDYKKNGYGYGYGYD